MNRRDLIRRGPMALLGLVGIAAGVRAQPVDRQRVIVSVSVPIDESQIVRVIRDNYMRGGEIREAIQRDWEWGL